jgi:hypothetical protein
MAARDVAGIAACCVLAIVGGASGATKTATTPAIYALVAPPAETPAPSPPAMPVAASVKIPEGTEVSIALAERLSSSTSAVGDTFAVYSNEDIRLADGTVIPAGYSGKGEVTVAEHNGMLGKSGQLGVRLVYLKIGDVHLHLRANRSGEGASGVTNTVVLTVLFGPLGLLVHGHSVVYPKGQLMTAYVDQDTQISLPVAPPPRGD